MVVPSFGVANSLNGGVNSASMSAGATGGVGKGNGNGATTFGGLPGNGFNSSYNFASNQLGVDPRGNNPNANILNNASIGLTPGLYSQIGFANQLNPLNQGEIMKGINNATSSTAQNAMSQALRGNLQAGGMNSAAQMQNQLLSGGAGIGAMQGAQVGAMNSANNAANSYQTQLASPTGQSQLQQQALGLIQQGQSIPALQQILGMSYPLLNQEQQNAAGRAAGGLGGALGSLGSIAGLFGGGSAGAGIGGLLGKILGGGGSGSGAAPTAVGGTPSSGGYGFGGNPDEFINPFAPSYSSGASAGIFGNLTQG